MIPVKDKICGSLVGGAIGDALGYPVEFISSYGAIQARYGERGITRYDGACVSDDTQMTLFTACGLLNAQGDLVASGIQSICSAYIEWYYTQVGKTGEKPSNCWISRLPELNVTRAPGNTCLSALTDINYGRTPHNYSKGCGGVMRIAPIALYGLGDKRFPDIKTMDRMAADAAEITHQHPLGYIPAAIMAHIIYRLAVDENPTRDAFYAYTEEALKTVGELYPEHVSSMDYMRMLVKKAFTFAASDVPDHEAIEHIGGGWVGEEALAIALYCVAKYFDNFENTMIAAVNHAGDSDSTGAIAGNILGAAIGYEALPEFYRKDVELHDVILKIADDIYAGKEK